MYKAWGRNGMKRKQHIIMGTIQSARPRRSIRSIEVQIILARIIVVKNPIVANADKESIGLYPMNTLFISGFGGAANGKLNFMTIVDNTDRPTIVQPRLVHSL